MHATRTIVLGGIAVAVAASAGVLGAENLPTREKALKEAAQRYLALAGWSGSHKILHSRDNPEVYFTSPLPTNQICSITLEFLPSGDWRVRDLLLKGEWQVVEMEGADNKHYPGALAEISSPTREQIERQLKAAGLDCDWSD